MKMTFKGTELKTPGMEVTRFLTWSGRNGFLPPYFSPEAQGIGQRQASPFGSSSFGQDTCWAWSLLPELFLWTNCACSPRFHHCLRGSGRSLCAFQLSVLYSFGYSCLFAKGLGLMMWFKTLEVLSDVTLAIWWTHKESMTSRGWHPHGLFGNCLLGKWALHWGLSEIFIHT